MVNSPRLFLQSAYIYWSPFPMWYKVSEIQTST
jgi:hypothetical protein